MNETGGDLGSFAMIAWSIWLHRIQLVFEERMGQKEDIIKQASELWAQFSTFQPSLPPRVNIPSLTTCWCMPPENLLKLTWMQLFLKDRESMV